MPRKSPLRAGLRRPTLYTFGEPELLALDDRTAHILRLRSGMGDGQLHTLDGVGEKIGISPERVRQIQSDGLHRILQFREAQRHLREEPKRRRPQPELQFTSRRTAFPDLPTTSHASDSAFQGWELYGKLADVGGKESTGDYPFPGWEPFLPHLVHPLKVAIVEALLWIGEPLSAVQLGKVFRGVGDGFRESNLRYHLRHLEEVGVLGVTPAVNSHEGKASREKFFYFADRTTRELFPDAEDVFAMQGQ